MNVDSKLITKRMPWHANMTEKNHLGKALLIKPEVFQSKFTQLFTSKNYYSENPLGSVLFNDKRVQEVESTEWEWELKGASTRPLIVLENIEPNTVSKPGAMRTTFLLKLDENWYKEGDILHPGLSDKRFQVRIQENPYAHGNGFAYRVRIMSDDAAFFIPLKYLQAGAQWTKLFSQYEEAGSTAGSTQYSLGIAMKNRMSRYKKEYGVTGDVANEVLAVAITDSKGKQFKSWIKYAETEYWQQWYREEERANWYSRTTDTVLGGNGRPIYTGPGIQEQLEDSHIHRYSTLTATLLEEYLMDIFYGRVKPGGSARKIKAFTGEYGMLMFSKALEAWQAKRGSGNNGITIIDSSNQFIKSVQSDYTSNALQVGYQFTKFLIGNGIELELIHNPLYDDREINFEIDPLTGKPVESQRFTFLDFSGEADNSNIRKVHKKGAYKLGYVSGLTTPYGPVNSDMMSHSGDWYTMIVNDQFGIAIDDVTRCGELILEP